jgi:hypothetical protein
MINYRDSIVQEYTNHKMSNLTREIDAYSIRVFSIPKWVVKRRWAVKIYAWWYQLVIESYRDIKNNEYVYKFTKRRKKVGEKIIRDIDLI